MMRTAALAGLLLLLVACGTMRSYATLADDFKSEPYGTYESRRADFLNHYTQPDPTIHPLYRVFRQVALAAAGQSLEPDEMEAVFAVIKSNRDCNDFALNGLLRLRLLFPEAMAGGMAEKAESRILDFKYWWDDVRPDTTYRCYHTENHQALYHTAELIAGQMYRDRVFADGNTGAWHMRHATGLLLPWLDFRFRFGFSEWNSTYYDAEVLLLLNLHDFAEDAEIRRKATNVLNLLMFDMAIGNFRGIMGAASSRNYAHSLITGTHNTSAVMKLAFGVGSFARSELMGSTAMVTSAYRCPQVIAGIAVDYQSAFTGRQRCSIEPDDAALYGLAYDNERDCRLFWGMQEFIHPKVIGMSKSVSEKYGVWPYGNYDEHIARYMNEIAGTGNAVSHDRFSLAEGNVVLRRTRHYMLSTVSDYHKGRQGYQQHVWQASLGNRAIVYTNSPGGTNLKASPNYWAGTERLPRAAQCGDVAVVIYKDAPSHAYFPVDDLDSVDVRGNWLFAAKGNAYMALFSSDAAEPTRDFRGVLCDVRPSSRNNVYLCQMGDSDTYGAFGGFIKAVSSSEVRLDDDGLTVTFRSPSEGEVRFGWDGPLTVNGRCIDMRPSVRYDNPYCRAPFDCDTITIVHRGRTLILLR